MTIREYIQAFRDWASDKTSQLSQNNSFSNRLIWHFVLYYRALFLHDKIKRGEDINHESKHIIPCIKLRSVDQVECPCAPLSGCKFKKTAYKLPRYIKIISVTSIDGSISYDYVEWDDFKDKLSHRIEAMRKVPYYTLKKIGNDVYLYVHNDIHKRFITVMLIPYDPSDIIKYPDCNGKINECISPLDVDFSTDPELESKIYESIANSLLRVKGTAEVDVFNNSIKDLGLPLK
jgi:hypothetical protein